MHIVTRLLCMGRKVGVIDLDGQQQTLGRYMENRAHFSEQRGLPLAMPQLKTIVAHRRGDRQSSEQEIYDSFCRALEELVARCDCVIVDCPGSDSFIARLGHNVADTLLTPINDSFIDIDLLARVHPDTFEVVQPSWYSEMVWDLRKRRHLTDRHAVDWVLMRNRLSPTDARNKRHVGQVLQKIAPRFGFRLAAGFGERVIFRELFLKGLTLSDLRHHKTGVQLTMTHIAAHQEIKSLVQQLKLDKLQSLTQPSRAVG